MNAEVVAEWFRRQRHRVVQTPSSWWYEASPRVYQAFPFHWSIRPGEGELEDLLRTRRALALRCSTPLDAPEGMVSYHVVCDDHGYDLGTLHGRARNKVRHGLQRARVEPVPLERMAEEGWQLEVETCRRQGRDVPWTREAWRQRHLTASALPGFEGWGALVDGRLAASLLCVRIDECCEVLGQQCLTEYLPTRVNNALAFVFTRSVLQRPGVRLAFYTLQSLDAPPALDEFKFTMGYRPAAVRQRVVVHPWAEHAFGPRAHGLVSAALRWRPESRLLAKAEGMLRFHLEGKLPVERQRWPACLEGGAPGGRAAAGTAGVAGPAHPRSPSGARTRRSDHPAAARGGGPEREASDR